MPFLRGFKHPETISILRLWRFTRWRGSDARQEEQKVKNKLEKKSLLKKWVDKLTPLAENERGEIKCREIEVKGRE